jgi:hypothetical protein
MILGLIYNLLLILYSINSNYEQNNSNYLVSIHLKKVITMITFNFDDK